VIAAILLASIVLQAPPMSAGEDRIVSRAVAYAPQDMRPLFKVFQEDFKRGLNRPATRPNAESLDRDIISLIGMIRKQSPMPAIMDGLAGLTRKTLLYLDPLWEGKGDPLSGHMRADFPRFMQSRYEKFPVVFYGFDAQLLRGDPLGYLKRQSSDLKDLSHLLRLDYTRTGVWADHRAFDDQSNAFGVAQISMNQRISTVLNLWYYVWTRGGGRWGPLKPGLNTEKLWVLGYGY